MKKVVACVAGVQNSLRDPNDRASRSHSTSPLPPLCTPATQAKKVGMLVENFEIDP